MINVIFMGTPEFSVGPLKAIAAHPDFCIKTVVTQPDKPVGRKKKLQSPAVKLAAQDLGLAVYQPESIRDQEAVAHLSELEADLLVTAAYGQFLPKALLDMPRYGAVNIHASLLPKYRGGAPVHYAILNGDDESGISYMEMVQKMDAGAILAQYPLTIEKDETTGQLFEALSHLAQETVTDTLLAYVKGELAPQNQEEERVSFSPNIPKEMENVDFSADADAIERKIRAFNPHPGAYILHQGQRLKLWRASLEGPDANPDDVKSGQAGTIVVCDKANLGILCGDGQVLFLKELQPSGKNPMSIKSFMNGQGRQLSIGERFDD